MKKLRQILQGWVFFILKLHSRRFKERYKICTSCTHNVDNVCALCGCPLQKKLRVKDAECDDERWGTVRNNEVPKSEDVNRAMLRQRNDTN